MDRKLAAVLAADVVGFSRLTARNETETLQRLAAWDAAVVEPTVARHGGRVFKKMGDGYLVEFGSVVAAVTCAGALQDATAAWREREVHDDPLRIRIGVHVGEVVRSGDDLLGNGVNVAARLEGVALPDTVCVSDDVKRHCAGRVDLGFGDLGERRLKNIPEPMRVWQLGGSDVRPPRRLRDLRSGNLAAAVALGVAVVALASVMFWPPSPHRGDDKGPPPPKVEDMPLLAVIPFDNGGDETTASLAHSLAFDLTTDLGHAQSFDVLARSISLKNPDPDALNKLYGVDYLVGGAIKTVKEFIRVSAYLVTYDPLTPPRETWSQDRDVSPDKVDEVRRQFVNAMLRRLEQSEHD